MRHRLFTFAFFFSAVASFAQTPAPVRNAIVYKAHEPDAINDYRTNSATVHAMVNRLVVAATGQPDVAHAWACLVSPKDTVGIKISAAGGELFTTHRDIVNAIAEGLAAAGYPKNKIIVWDRSLDGVKDAGYRPGAEAYQMLAVPPGAGYDAKTAFSAPLLGELIWGDLDYKSARGKTQLLGDVANESDQSHFCSIVSNLVTKIINVPVLCDNRSNGIAGCLYNVTVPNVDNWRRFGQSGGFGAGAIAEIYSNPIIQKKVVLNIMDGLLAQYAGGPEGQPNYAVQLETIYASKDPVALDSIALHELEKLRANAKFPAIGSLAVHVQAAAQMGLGVTDPAHIEVKNVGR